MVETLEPRKLLTVTFGGGPVLAHVEVQGVYLGADWQNVAATYTQNTQLEGFNASIASGAYMDMLTTAGYGVGRGTSSTGYIDPLNLSKTGYLQDSQIQAELQTQITSGHLQTPDANRLYVVYVEPGVSIMGSDGSTSVSDFLGYHDSFTGHTAAGSSISINYAVIAYPGSRNPSYTSQGFSTAIDQLTDVASHEIGEAVTDPIPGYGWYDNNYNAEIGDLSNLGFSNNPHFTHLNGYLVQDLVNKNDQLIMPSTTTAGLTAPTGVQFTANSTTKVTVSWQAVAGASGYIVQRLVNGSWTQVGTVTGAGSGTLSLSVGNLTPGSQVTFAVQAYNATTQATSSSVTITMPNVTTTQLTPPTHLAIHQTSRSTASLTWTGSAAASGYGIYYWNGYRWSLLGNVTGTSTTISGLAQGATYYFQVVAFNATTSATALNYVSITTK